KTKETPRARRSQRLRHGSRGVAFAFVALLAFSFVLCERGVRVLGIAVELDIVERLVLATFALQQFLVRPTLNDSAILHDVDATGAANRREPVRDDDGRLALHQPVHRLEDELFRTGVEA